MPIYTVELDGKQFDIQGDSTPTEQDARAAINQHYSSQNKGNPQETEQPLFSEDSAPSQGDGIIKGLSGDVARGALNSIAATVDKINAAKDILKNVTGIDANSGGELKHISEFLKQSAQSQPTLDNPILSGIGEFAGSIPAALAEFAGTGGGAGFIARSAALSALQEYSKDESPLSLVKGASTGAIIGAGLNKAPEVLEKASILASKWGATAGKAYLKAITGMTEDEASIAIRDINKFNINPKKEAEDFKDYKASSSKEIQDFKDNTNMMVANQKEQFNSEYQLAKDKSDMLLQDMKDSHAQALVDVRERNLMNNVALRRSNEEELLNITNKGAQDLADATMAQVQRTAEAKNSLDNSIISLFDSSRKKLSSMIEGLNKNIGMAKNALQQSGNAYVPTDILQKELDMAIKDGGRFGFFIPRVDSTGKNMIVLGNKGTSTPATNGAINLINHVRSNLISDFSGLGKTSLAALDANEALLEGAISKGFAGEALPKDLATVLSNIKASISLTRKKIGEDGSVAQGLFDKYPDRLAHLKPLAEANKMYSANIDNLRNALSLYSDNIEGALIPNPGKVFSALDKNNLSFITKLKQADAALPESDRIFSKVKSIYDDYKFVEKSEKESLSLLQKEISQTRTLTRSKFDQMEENASIIHRKQLEEAKSTLGEKMSLAKESHDKALNELRANQKEQIAAIKNQRDTQLSELQSSINDRLQFLHIQSILRGTRPTNSSIARLGQNLSLYKTFNGVVTMNPASLLQGLIGGSALSPMVVSNMVKNAVNAPATNARAKAIISNKVLKKILATKARGQ